MGTAESATHAPLGPVPLPELASVWWRRRVDERVLRRSARLWTLTTAAHTVPLLAGAVLLAVLAPITIPVGVILAAHAWAIPELYAARGAKVIRPARRSAVEGPAERRALGLLGDLVGHTERGILQRTGLVLEGGRLGVWVVGERGALLVRPGGRSVACFCVRAPAPELPAADRIAHLLLALRSDETGFATLANLAFHGASWRVRRRLSAAHRSALDHARAMDRSGHSTIFVALTKSRSRDPALTRSR